jgi:hypothetical protein
MAVRRYVRVQSDRVPGRTEALALIATLAGGSSTRPDVLDLGCGHGELKSQITAVIVALT